MQERLSRTLVKSGPRKLGCPHWRMRFYCSLPVDVCRSVSWPKLEPRSENVELVSLDEDPNRELSEGTCQDGNVDS